MQQRHWYLLTPWTSTRMRAQKPSLFMVGPMNLQKLAQTGKLRRDHADCTKCFALSYKLLGSPRWSIEDCLVLKVQICVLGNAPRCVPHQHDTSDFFFKKKNYYYSGASNKHYNFCDDEFLPFIISVTLHTDLWKLAPYFKRKKKKRVCYSIVCYRRTIDCGMQFKDDICQQMPCIIWHCRNSNLFLFWK